MLSILPFFHYVQLDKMDCGPACLRMIAKYYGKNYTLQSLREHSFITREGVSMLGISDGCGIYWFSNNRGENLFGATEKGSASSLHSPLESKPFRCFVQSQKQQILYLRSSVKEGCL